MLQLHGVKRIRWVSSILDRVWRLMVNEDGTLSSKIVTTNNKSLDKVYNQTVKKVTEDFETLGFNTAISQLMVFINECYKVDEVYKPYIEGFVKMLAPIAPHIGEELWSKLDMKSLLRTNLGQLMTKHYL